MSERSFALSCVGLALAFGLVVPEPGKAPEGAAATPEMVMVQPVAQPGPDKEIDRMQGEPFAVHHAAPAKQNTTSAVYWPARGTP
ncbi:hypothetical protein [Massilia soli]|uniref:Uncharacterized protein n=1 Tax=Massilia soli TaxID=2792854 RepID=A0ABS7SU80_9BURK|nr:hypothetical protein [Massilia soli]MBZ2209501.1 hypothetical protein [Massilia soli]